MFRFHPWYQPWDQSRHSHRSLYDMLSVSPYLITYDQQQFTCMSAKYCMIHNGSHTECFVLFANWPLGVTVWYKKFICISSGSVLQPRKVICKTVESGHFKCGIANFARGESQCAKTVYTPVIRYSYSCEYHTWYIRMFDIKKNVHPKVDSGVSTPAGCQPYMYIQISQSVPNCANQCSLGNVYLKSHSPTELQTLCVQWPQRLRRWSIGCRTWDNVACVAELIAIWGGP